MDKKIRSLIVKNVIRDIQLKLLKQKDEGMIINEQVINEILAEIEEAEIDEGGEEITEEDEEKISDAIDTTDLGARVDMEYALEVNK